MNPKSIIERVISEYNPKKFILMVSGGHDSITNAHISATILTEMNLAFEVYHGDTTIGIPETQEYVKRICESYGWKLNIRQPPNKNWWYEKIVERYGFPGPTKKSHQYMYRYLKERALNKFVSHECKTRPHSRENIALLSGVRQSESTIRMGYSETINKQKSKIWVAPIFYLSEKDVHDYMTIYNIPCNPVKERICISGECLCGCFARNEEWAEIQAAYPETAKRINDLWEIAKCNGFPWHWASGPTEWKKEQTEKNKPKQAMLEFMCVGCEKKYKQ